MGVRVADDVRLALLIPGGHGQLGQELTALGVGRGDVWSPGSTELDITDQSAVAAAVTELVDSARATGARPVVINAAAYTAVDAAETDVERARAVNAVAPGLLASACARHGVPLVQVSTDYVFAGSASRPYEPDDPTDPRSVYGRSKLAGERAVLTSSPDAWVVRTAWVYGAVGGNFVRTIIRLERERDTVSVVSDQYGSPTWSADLARGLMELAGRLATGRGPSRRVLHCAGGGEATWFLLARAVFEELGADPARVMPCGTVDFPRPAPRPVYSVLSGAAWTAEGLPPLRPWRQALSAFFREHGRDLAR